MEGARCFFTYQTTDMPLLSTLYEPLSKQLISVLGESATVALTGRKATRVWFGAMNLRLGHRLVWRRSQQAARALLSVPPPVAPVVLARRRIGLLSDEVPGHLAARSQTWRPNATLG